MGRRPPTDQPPLSPLLPQAIHHAAASSTAVVGVYAANPRLADAALPPAARAAADAVARAAGGAPLALLLDGASLPTFSKGGGGVPYVAWTKTGDGRWAASGDAVVGSTGASALFADAVAAGKLDAVADFDDHLVDVRRDWLNRALVA